MKLNEQQHNFDISLSDGRYVVNSAVVTIVPAAYAEGDDHDDDNGDGNKNKAEDESQAALADCDDNDVEEAGFDCVAVAEIEEGGLISIPICPGV